jgi:hypothetical protein
VSADLAQRLLAARLQGGEEGRRQLAALLHPQARYMVLGKELAGAESVAQELVDGPIGALARRLDWQPPRVVDGSVRLYGERKPGTRDRGIVLTLGFEGDAIALVQEQRTTPPPADAQPMVLPDALKRRVNHALAEKHPMLVAYTDPRGQPVLSFRGSVQVFGDDALSLWIRAAEGQFVQAIRANPRVALMYRDEEAKATYQFQGRARVTEDADERHCIFQGAPGVERAHDFAQLGVAVIVDLDRVEGYAGLGPQGQVDPLRLQRGAAAH